MFYVYAKYLACRMKIEEFVVQQTTNWTFLKKKCQACTDLQLTNATYDLFSNATKILNYTGTLPSGAGIIPNYTSHSPVEMYGIHTVDYNASNA